ncbi:hypothetical protein K488DRAFT_72222 [Vararia minispora EC-137]|uniref:Uncharacterized protein n=1 Tax=Vararia minispora EC-137 TaxID=1314806 RepID=A0ACB8QF02_9AGAM|nr:hypothetical protein K488DRAFT_72222 [Vararia minispora EC-137]
MAPRQRQTITLDPEVAAILNEEPDYIPVTMPFDESLIDPQLRDKRPRPDEDDSAAGNGRSVSANLVLHARSLGQAKRLKTNDCQALEQFAKADVEVQLVESFALGLEVKHLLSTMQVATPFKLSSSAEVNINYFAGAVLVSPRVPFYRDDALITIVLNVLTQRTKDVPLSVMKNPAHMHEVCAAIREAFTQHHANFKKIVRFPGSVAHFVANYEILKRATAASGNPSSTISVPFCARVTMMRTMYGKSVADLWGDIDAQLATIREQAGNDSPKILRIYKHFLESDIRKYGDLTMAVLSDRAPAVEVPDGCQEHIAEFLSALGTSAITATAATEAATNATSSEGASSSTNAMFATAAVGTPGSSSGAAGGSAAEDAEDADN